jgi:Archease protein family (MTH1598/TM1083)
MVFPSAAEASMNVMVDEFSAIEKTEHRRISLWDEAVDMLLFGFIRELIFLKDAEQLLLRVSRIFTEKCSIQTDMRSTQMLKPSPCTVSQWDKLPGKDGRPLWYWIFKGIDPTGDYAFVLTAELESARLKKVDN